MRRRRLLFASLRARLLLLVFLAVVPAAALIIYTGLETRSQAIDQARSDNQTVSQLAAAQQSQLLEGSRQLMVPLALLVTAMDLDKADPNTCGSALLGALLREFPSYANIGVVKPDGDIVCSGLPLGGTVNLADRDWFQHALTDGGFTVGSYQVGRVTGLPTLNIAFPVIKGGSTYAVIYLALNLQKLNDVISDIRLPSDTVVNVTDANGIILAQTPNSSASLGRTLADSTSFLSVVNTDAAAPSAGSSAPASGGEPATAPGKTSLIELKGSDGVARLYAYTPIGTDTGLYASAAIPKSAVYATANSALRRNLTLLLLAAALAGVAAWFGGDFFFLKRTRALVAATERLGAGDRAARSGLHDSSELGKLATSFDTMADALELNARERDEALAELGRRNEELEAFTYSVSHDLKEPLRTLKTFSQFMLQDYGDIVEDDGKEYLQGIGDASVRMARQIDELMAMSRLSRDATPTRVDLDGLIEGIIVAHRGAIEAKGAKVTVRPGLPHVWAHASRVEQIFSNLISNAIKFNNGDEPRVEIGALDEHDGMATIYVKDNGVGIEPEFHVVIFKLFHRLNRREEFEGTGAGLAIARRAAEVSGGSIRLESTPGEGTTFYVTLPLSASLAAAQAA